MKTFTRWFPAFLLIAVLTCGIPALAATAWVSVPSTPDATGKVLIIGGGLAPSNAVTLKIERSDGFSVEQQEFTTAEGTLRAEFQPPLTGSYSVKAYDQNGTLIGSSNFIHNH